MTWRQPRYRDDRTLHFFKHESFHWIATIISAIVIAIIIIAHILFLLSTFLCDPERLIPTGTAIRANGTIVSGVTKKPGSVTGLKQRSDSKYVPQGRKAPPPVVGAGSGMLASADPAPNGSRRQRVLRRRFLNDEAGRPTKRKKVLAPAAIAATRSLAGVAVQRRCSNHWTGMTARVTVVALATLFWCWF